MLGKGLACPCALNNVPSSRARVQVKRAQKPQGLVVSLCSVGDVSTAGGSWLAEL